ncbi:MAG: protein phosphatase 2C domain-containing protein [Bacteroidota bacterium]|nr:protein phosphatase 2C domain-containing protein [Bacteroidota bacterium]
MGIFKKFKKSESKQLTGSYSDKGRRDNQEDNFLITKEFNNKRLLLVADGLGGLEYGEYASQQVVEAFQNFFVQIENFNSPKEFLSRTALVVASMIMNKSVEDERYQNCASTLSGFLIEGNHYFTVNVGDSRVYHFSDKKLKQITKDQSFVQFLLDKGDITQEEAFTHPKKNIVNSIISSKISNLKTDITGPHDLKKGDILFACTDGVHDALKIEEIEQIVKKNMKNKSLSEIIGKKAFDAGSKDNITICYYKH